MNHKCLYKALPSTFKPPQINQVLLSTPTAVFLFNPVVSALNYQHPLTALSAWCEVLDTQY